MSVYLKDTLIAAGLVAAATVSAQLMLTASTTDCPPTLIAARSKKSRSKHHTRRPALTAAQCMARFDSFAARQKQALQITAA